jgi:hypothetical protein
MCLCFGPCHHRTTNTKHQHHRPSFDKIAPNEAPLRTRKSGKANSRAALNRAITARPMDRNPNHLGKSLSRALLTSHLTPTKSQVLILRMLLPRNAKQTRPNCPQRAHRKSDDSTMLQMSPVRHLVRRLPFNFARTSRVRYVLVAVHHLTGSVSA